MSLAPPPNLKSQRAGHAAGLLRCACQADQSPHLITRLLKGGPGGQGCRSSREDVVDDPECCFALLFGRTHHLECVVEIRDSHVPVQAVLTQACFSPLQQWSGRMPQSVCHSVRQAVGVTLLPAGDWTQIVVVHQLQTVSQEMDQPLEPSFTGMVALLQQQGAECSLVVPEGMPGNRNRAL